MLSLPKRNYSRNNCKTGVKTYEQSVEDFWVRVDSTNLGDATKCWNWLGWFHKKNGYGWCSFQGKQLLAHRASYIVHFGSIPTGLSVCHRCDNPACVNPNHLFVGTQTDNMRDMVREKDVERFGSIREKNVQQLSSPKIRLDISYAQKKKRVCWQNDFS